MGKVVRLAVLSVSLLAMVSSSAGAVTWHNNGDFSFHSTSGASTLSGTGANGLICASATATGSTGATPFVGPVWKGLTGTVKWSNCNLGTNGWTVDCSYVLTATDWQPGPPTAVTSGTADVTCSAWLAGSNPCHIGGNVEAHYVNPAHGTVPTPASTTGSLTVTTGGNLTITNGRTGTCPLGTNDPGHISHQTFTVITGTGFTKGPIITRTS